MSAGTKDRLVKLLLGTVARESTFSGEQVTYTELDQVWAQVTESAAASLGGTPELAGHAWPHKITIYARADVRMPMRVQLDDGRIVQINGIARLGRADLMLAGTEWGHQQP